MAMEIGIRPRDFWRMTLREFFYNLDAFNNREEREFRMQRALVWSGEALRRQKKLMSLKSFLFEGKTYVPPEEELKEIRENHSGLLDEYMSQKLAK